MTGRNVVPAPPDSACAARRERAAAPTRPALRYHGGKWRLAPWIIGFFPEHRVYVEPFGGAASILLRKPRTYAEVYNDLDGEVVNVFRVLRDPVQAATLRRVVELTPFARDEFKDSYQPSDDPVESARRAIVRSFMGYGSASVNTGHSTSFRSTSNRSGTTPAHDWVNWPAQIEAFTRRLQGVVIENRPATEVIAQQDSPDALHYVDPPYPWATRKGLEDRKGLGVAHAYRHELTDADHRALAEVLRGVRGMVVLSGYGCPLYDDELFADWERHEKAHFADGARPRTEVVWLNKACAEALRAQQGRLL